MHSGIEVGECKGRKSSGGGEYVCEGCCARGCLFMQLCQRIRDSVLLFRGKTTR